jgi:KTSC domain
MQRVPVRSSTIAEIGYEEETSILEIEFQSGAIYEYLDVPSSVYSELLTAPSIGRYFDQNVKKAGYPCRRTR